MDDQDASTAECSPRLIEPGGDAACWLDRVCEECGALVEGAPGATCWRCGIPLNRT